MIVKINNKEYSFDGYVNLINSVQRLAEEIYQQGKVDAIAEISREMRMLYGNEYEKQIRADAINEMKDKLQLSAIYTETENGWSGFTVDTKKVEEIAERLMGNK